MAITTLKKIEKKENQTQDVVASVNAISNVHYENKPELIWENMQMIAFANKIFLKLA